jgi:OOP family OmpA-OmpF porin
MKKTLLRLAMTSAIVLIPTAYAADSGLYLGLSAGQGTAKDLPSAGEFDAALASLGVTTSSSSTDDSDFAFKLFGGYKVNKYFALEGSWTDLGEATYSANIVAPVSASANANWEASAFALSALGILPLGSQFELFGKVGLTLWDADLRVSAAGIEESADEDGSGAVYGIGANFNFTPNLAIRAEWERYDGIGEDDTTGESDFDMWSAGLQYNF